MSLGFVQASGRGENDRLLADVAERLEAMQVSMAGVVQTNVESADCDHCDMDLRVLGDDRVFRISQSLGSGSSGCRLDAGALEAAVAVVQSSMSGKQVLMVNKFGKHEASGRGFRELIAEALIADMIVVVGVNAQNLDGFMAFCDHDAVALPSEAKAIVDWVQQSRA